MKFNYKHTLYAGFAGYIVQSIVNSFCAAAFYYVSKKLQSAFIPHYPADHDQFPDPACH